MSDKHLLLYTGTGTAILAAVVSLACSRQTAAAPSVAPNAPSPVVVRVAVSGDAPALGATSQLRAVATMSDGASQDVTARAQWRSSQPTIVAVSATGIAAAISPGESDITATFETVVGSQRLAVVAPPSARFTLTGVIRDAASQAAIPGARVEIISGVNQPSAATTDDRGVYELRDLIAGAFRLRASANGFDAGEQNVTVPANPEADFLLRRRCVYGVTPTQIGFSGGGLPTTRVDVTTAASCSWTVAASTWISISVNGGPYLQTVPQSSSGSGFFYVGVGVTACYREGSVNVAGDGSSTAIFVSQGPGRPPCAATVVAR